MASARIGQADIFSGVKGLEKLVQKPDVIESEGLKVVHFALSEEDRKVPGYIDEVSAQARKLEPEVRSRGKPPWMTASYQAKKRKEKAGVL